MFSLGILDVGIGLAFVYLMASLICTSINEIIESWLKNRASDLEKGIRDLLGDPGGTGLMSQLYNHPLVNGLFQGVYNPANKKQDLPSYIPARNFATALMDLMVIPPTAPAAENPPTAENSPTAENPPIAENPPTVENAPTAGNAGDAAGIIIKSIDGTQVDRALRALAKQAGNNLDRLRVDIEAWYNSAMDRIAGTYKRRAQMAVLVIGLLVTIAANIDTITIVNSLSTDPAVRNSMVAAAQEYARRDSAVSDTTGANANNPKMLGTLVENDLRTIRQAGLPIGWDCSNPRIVPRDLTGWLTKIVGWILTAAAISLGAPFWFDTLNKFIVVRSTVKPREKSKEEPSKD
ncbi:MAG: hypothetical protein JWQ98_629 [Chlorobi bacterium]|nr:hypothetical protein [Chlorobiota bacterium]